MRPREHLDRAIHLADGEEYVLTFGSSTSATHYMQRLRAAMSVEVAFAKRELEPDDPAWGTHPWEGVTFTQRGVELVLRRDREPIVRVRKGEGA